MNYTSKNNLNVVPQKTRSTALSISAMLFGLWGILHLWVGFEGLHQYFGTGVVGQWKMFIGGSKAPVAAFVFPADLVTAHVHANLILNFCLDVAGYGLLGIVIGALLYTRSSWTAYLIGAVIIGMCDLSFTFLQLTSGVIELSVPSISGPVVWLLAVIIAPFGLPRWKRRTVD